MPITHTFVSAKADGVDGTLVRPTDWNAAHVGGLSNVVEDATPQLGGDLDLNGKSIDFPTTPNISDCLDEDNMASNSATKLATQQSIKAYADTKLTNGFRLKPSDQSVNNSGVPVVTAGLSISLLINEVWMFKVIFIGEGVAGTNLLIETLGPAGCLVKCRALAADVGDAVYGYDMHQGSSFSAVVPAIGSNRWICEIEGMLINGGTAGDFDFLMSQQIPTVGDTTVKANSCVFAVKLA